MPNRPFVAGGASAALVTTSYSAAAVLTLTEGTGLDPVPDEAVLDTLELRFASAAPGSVTCKITRDAAGDQLLAGPSTSVLEVGVTTATAKCAVFELDQLDYKRGAEGVAGKLYVHVLVDAGSTLVCTGRLTGRQL